MDRQGRGRCWSGRGVGRKTGIAPWISNGQPVIAPKFSWNVLPTVFSILAGALVGPMERFFGARAALITGSGINLLVSVLT